MSNFRESKVSCKISIERLTLPMSQYFVNRRGGHTFTLGGKKNNVIFKGRQ